MSVAHMENSALDRLAARAERKRQFVLLDELEASSSKSWLVDKMLGVGEMSAIYGPPGCGKGVIVEDLALHITAGIEWHGRPVTRGAVVYVALERRQLVVRRAIGWRIKHDLRSLPFAIVGGVYDFRSPAVPQQIADICRQVEEATGEQVVLVIVDTVSRALAGGDENSPKDMGALVTSIAQLQERTKAHVLLVHHIPHDSERLRGHGALLGAVDTTISVTNSGGVRAAKVVKANDSEEGEGITFTIESIEIGADGTTAGIAVPSQSAPAKASPDAKLSTNQRVMFRLLCEAGTDGLNVEQWNELAHEQGLTTKQRRYEARMALKDKGLVREYSGVWHANR